jgi:hypothetical protein
LFGDIKIFISCSREALMLESIPRTEISINSIIAAFEPITIFSVSEGYRYLLVQ